MSLGKGTGEWTNGQAPQRELGMPSTSEMLQKVRIWPAPAEPIRFKSELVLLLLQLFVIKSLTKSCLLTKSMITKLRWICVLRCFFEQAANGFREGLRLDELTDFGGDLF